MSFIIIKCNGVNLLFLEKYKILSAIFTALKQRHAKYNLYRVLF